MKKRKPTPASKKSAAARQKAELRSDRASNSSKTDDLATVTTEDREPMTTNHGTPISTDQDSLKAGVRGPTLLEDQILREKIQHFDHERIPERVVHALGAAAHG
ncbi:MAG: catalase, partial [Chthoniobacterales bacterium]